MSNQITMKTGNPIVDMIGRFNFNGNIVPETWYRTIVNEKGKTNTLALLILSDIVYWYRPTEVRDEKTNNVYYKKKFNADILQRNYNQLCEKFNCSQKQAREALIFLEDLKVINRVFRTIEVGDVKVGNVMFIELDPEVLYKLTFIEDNHTESEDYNEQEDSENTLFTKKEIGISENEKTFPKSNTLFTKKEIGVSQKGKTNTKNTTKITTEITTTTTTEASNGPSEDVVVKVKELYKDFDFADNDIMSIIKASDYSIEKCKKALEIFDQQTSPVRNVVGWFISALKEDYTPPKTSQRKNRSSKINNFKQRDYDFKKLENALLYAHT